jgi:hypothetical protein
MNKFQRTMCWLMLLLTVYFTGLVLWQNKVQCEYEGVIYQPQQTNVTTRKIEVSTTTVEVIYETPKDIITRLTAHSQVSTKTALRIAECESKLGKYQTNLSGSSAYGLYQFTAYTWEHYCSGSRDNYIDQTNCFIKLYGKHKNWWSCK